MKTFLFIAAAVITKNLHFKIKQEIKERLDDKLRNRTLMIKKTLKKF